MVVCLLYQMGPYSNLKNQRTVSIPAEVGMDDDIVCHCYLVKYVKASEKIAGHIQNVPCIQSKNEHFIPAEHEVCFIRVNFFRLLYSSIDNQSPKRGQEVKMCITIQGHKYYAEKPEESCLCFSNREENSYSMKACIVAARRVSRKRC